ncbi:hypothetical protein Agub_g7681 [Astrephomene gubernaculifera]|uniref:Uncharacterized protein n=1 Tax=Astrephomene gubernaculifera TaxID=47775 RepID=A0AAD3DQG1_9CHLO|nr:hypothetical protein Agub_g7681 [Astrephomene gubernaculifera]
MRKSQLSQAFAAGAIVTTQEGHGALAPVPQGEPPAGGATGQGPAGLGQPAAAVQPITAAAAARQVATAAAAAATTVPVQDEHVLDIEEQVDTEGFPALAQTLGPLAPPPVRQAAPQGVETERPERGVRRAVEGPLKAAVLPPSKVPQRLAVQGAGILDSWLDTLATGPGAGMTATGAQRSALGPCEKTLTSSIDMEDTAAMAPFMSELLTVAGVQRLSTNQDIFNSHAKSVISASVSLGEAALQEAARAQTTDEQARSLMVATAAYKRAQEAQQVQSEVSKLTRYTTFPRAMRWLKEGDPDKFNLLRGLSSFSKEDLTDILRSATGQGTSSNRAAAREAPLPFPSSGSAGSHGDAQ